MPVYVIFNRKTGEPVHTHFEPEDAKTSREGLLSMVDPSHDSSLLEVALVDTEDVSVGDAYRIDTHTGKLKVSEKREAAGFGTGSCRLFDPQATTRPVRTVFRPVKTGFEYEPPESKKEE